MSQENVELVRRIYEAAARHDSETVLDLYDPEIEMDFTNSPFASVFRQDVYRGYDGLREFSRERHEEAWEDFFDEIDELLDTGEQVVSVVSSGGRGRVSGVDVARTHAGVWTIRDGRVIRVVWFGDREAALAAARPSGAS